MPVMTCGRGDARRQIPGGCRSKQWRPGVKPERCQAITKGGSPCAATAVPGDRLCAWHSPAWAEKRREWSKKGGAGRSNAQRAKKALGESHDLTAVQARLVGALEKVEAGQLDPSRAQAMAALGRAIVTVSQAGEVEQRLRELEAAAGLTDRRRA